MHTCEACGYKYFLWFGRRKKCPRCYHETGKPWSYSVPKTRDNTDTHYYYDNNGALIGLTHTPARSSYSETVLPVAAAACILGSEPKAETKCEPLQDSTPAPDYSTPAAPSPSNDSGYSGSASPSYSTDTASYSSSDSSSFSTDSGGGFSSSE